MNLVIVEDSELVLYQLLRLIARQPAINMVGVASGEDDAVAIILATRPDAVLLDLALTTGNGVHVLQRVRELGCTARMLVLTNHTSDIMRRSCEALGIDGFYDKSREVEQCLAQLYSGLPPAAGRPA